MRVDPRDNHNHGAVREMEELLRKRRLRCDRSSQQFQVRRTRRFLIHLGSMPGLGLSPPTVDVEDEVQLDSPFDAING